MNPIYRKLLCLFSICTVSFMLFITNATAQICGTNAGLDKTICITQQPLQLAGTIGNSQSATSFYLWKKLAGPQATILAPDSLTTSVTGLVPGNYVFQFTSRCINGLFARDIVSITVLPEPATPVAGPDIDLCFNSPIRLSGNAVSTPNVGTWTDIPAGGTFSPNANDPNAIYTAPARPGVRRLIWTISNGACSKPDDILINFAEPAVTVSAGPDDTLSCKGKCAVLAAAYPGFSPQNGLWTLVSGPNIPVFSSAANPSSKVCNLVPGTYTFRWTVSGPCVNGSDDMNLYVANIKTPPASLGNVVYTNFCDEPIVSSEVLTGAQLSPGDTATWTQTGGGSVATFSPDNHGSSVFVGNLTGPFPYKFIYTHIGPTGCTMVTTHTVYRSQLLTGLTDPPDQQLPCNVTATSFIISYNKLNTLSNSVVKRCSFVSGPSDTGKIKLTNSATTGLTTRDTWSVSRLDAAGTYIFRLEYSNACGSSFQDISFTVSRTAGTVNAGSDIILPCHDVSVNPVGSVNTGGIYTWSQVAGPGLSVLTGANTLSPELSGLTQGVYTFRLSNRNGDACPAETDDMNVTVTQQAPIIATTGADTATCAGNYRLTGNTPLPAETGTWTVTPTTGIGFYPDEHTANAFVTGLAPNSIYTFTWTVSNICGSLSATQNITTGSFLSAPVPDAGEDICLIPGTIITTLSGNDPMGANILWTALTAGSAVNPANEPTTEVTFSNGSGTYLFEYALGTPGCATLKDTIKLMIRSGITLNAGTDIYICTAVLPATAVLNATFSPASIGFGAEWRQVSGSSDAVITSLSDPASSVTNLRLGTYEFEYKLTTGNDCDHVSDTVMIKVLTSPSEAIAGPGQAICSVLPGTIVTLAATEPANGTGQWQVISGPAGSSTPVFSNQQLPGSEISNLTQGTYNLRWTVTNGTGCPANTDDMILDINAAAYAGPDRGACSITNIQLTGNPNTNGLWSIVSGAPGAVISANSGNTAVASNLVTSPAPAVYRFKYSIPQAGACPASSDDLIVTNYPVPSPANAGGDKVLCFDETTVTLTGNDPLTGTTKWFFESGPNVPSPGSPNNLSNDTILNNLIPGMYVYRYQVSTVPACATLTETVQIIKQAKANAREDFRICNLSVVYLNANVPLLGQGTWSYISGPLTPGDVIFSNVNNPATSVSGLVTGSYIFRWSLPDIGACIANEDDVQVTVDPLVPPISAGTGQVFCQGTTTAFVIGSVAIPGVTYTWSPAALLSNTNVAQPVFQGVDNAGNFIYTMRANIGACESYSYITINVKPTPFANIEVTDGNCGAIFIASAPGSGVNNPTFNWDFSSNATPGIATGPGPHPVVFNNAATNNINLEIITFDGCSSSASLNYSPFCVVPVKLRSFDAYWKNSFTEISWEVEDAINFSHFELERSYNGREFGLLHSTNYIDHVKKYIYADRTVSSSHNGDVFYRLRMIDTDHSFTYSPFKTIRLRQDTDNGIHIWPNPFTDQISIGYTASYLQGNTSIKIYSSTGQTLVYREMNITPGNELLEIRNLGKLPPGLYSLQIISKGIVINHKILKRYF